MTFEIGQLNISSAQPAPARPAPAAAGEPPAAARPGAVDSSDVIPASPPPEVLAEVDAAWERGAQLAAENRELHFERDEASGRTIIQVRTLDGEVLRTIPPADALDVIAGGAL
jgi:hypothetical protein